MVKVSEVEYDGGNDKGPGLVTKRIAYVADSTTGKRETSFLHDGRGRMIVQVNPQGPHSVRKLDHLGRVVATAMCSG